ncbi:hypothetical protein [Paraburkholderia sp. UCT2]|uniref:hypothetical protein n=1 Tax=Paraburkholderia sp. UCT2 TaxID=2615208 RepID=UPI0016566395|nr:hypothetical protein [Paraburkholderia sp. UCT2]MBC8730003.1 hypothetical protein [Paraburkholderia sp. UCT2]
MGTRWSEKEKRTLKRIWKSPKPLDSHIHLLPGRSVDCARAYGRSIGLPTKQRTHAASRERIVQLMKDKVARTGSEVSKAVNLDRKTVRDLLVSLIALDKVHLTGEYGPYKAAYYQFGPTPEGKPKLTRARPVPRGEARRRAMAEAKTEEELDRLLDAAYRAPARKWSRADPVVIAAFDAMVRTESVQP